MRKTKDPKLFAALIREGVPADRFCCDALSSALPAVLRKFGIANADVAVKIESSDDHFVHESDRGNHNAIVIKLKRAIDGQSPGHFYISNDISNTSSGNGYDCLFHCLADQINAQYNVDLDPTQMREVAASMVEKDPSVSQAIRYGLHKYTLDKGFYGGKAEFYENYDQARGNGGLYDHVRKFANKDEVEADHQPAASMWKHFAKDKWIRELNKKYLGSMTISKKLHMKTHNYGGKWKQHSEFNKQQREFMQNGNYKEAIYHAATKNWIELSKESADEIAMTKKGFNDYVDSFTKFHKVGDSRKQIINSQEANELKIRFEKLCHEVEQRNS
jgi:hypothetical protein